MSEHINNQKVDKRSNQRKWLVLGAIGTALLLIPRRSSRYDEYASAGLHKRFPKKTDEHIRYIGS